MRAITSQEEGDDEGRAPGGDIPLDDEFDLDEDEMEGGAVLPDELSGAEAGVNLSDNLPL